MTLTVRLNEHLQGQLDRYCKASGMTKTQVVTQLLSEHLSPAPRDASTPLTLARQFGVVGSFASGQGDLAQDRKRHLMDKLRAKRSG